MCLTFQVRISSLSWSCTGGVVALGISHTEHENWCDHSASVYMFNINRQDLSSALTPNKTLETSSCVVSLSSHPFEPSILAAGTYREVLVWNLQRDDDCLICTSSNLPGSHREAISQVSWIRNPDSTQQQPLLVSAGRDGRILVWKVGTHSGNLQLNEGFILTLERLKYLSPEMHVPSPVGGAALGLELGVSCFTFSPLDFSSFVVGVDGGVILSCSTIAARPAPVDADIPLKDPVLQAFEKHQGAAAPLQMIHIEKGVLGVEWCIARANLCAAWGNSSHTVLFYNMQSGEVVPSLQLSVSEKPALITVLRKGTLKYLPYYHYTSDAACDSIQVKWLTVTANCEAEHKCYLTLPLGKLYTSFSIIGLK
ncbi:hypothetical protein C0J52_10485 [Blattella germanica]|nr:hypothetical protein C0J52_10485 [Blattella germanica]